MYRLDPIQCTNPTATRQVRKSRHSPRIRAPRVSFVCRSVLARAPDHTAMSAAKTLLRMLT